MTREDAQAIVDNFKVVKWFAEGGQLEYNYPSDSDEVQRWALCTESHMLIKNVSRYRIAEGCICDKCDMKGFCKENTAVMRGEE